MLDSPLWIGRRATFIATTEFVYIRRYIGVCKSRMGINRLLLRRLLGTHQLSLSVVWRIYSILYIKPHGSCTG